MPETNDQSGSMRMPSAPAFSPSWDDKVAAVGEVRRAIERVRAEIHRAIVDHAPRLIHPLVDWADRRWLAEPPQVRTLLGAAAAGGGFVGLVLGAWLTQSSSALLTSMVGAIFALVGALPFAARHFDRVAEGPRPVGWLLLWIALSLAGWLFQTRKGENPAREPGEPSLRRRRTHATGGR